MREPRKTDFRPRWLRTLTPEAELEFAEMPPNGSVPWDWPRITTRILMHDHGYRLSLRSVSEVTQLTQKLADYAGYDVVYGPNPNFADLRSLSSEVTRFTKLTSEPFEVGSFTIPARFESDPVEIMNDVNKSRYETDQIAMRFAEMLGSIESSTNVTDVSVGALQTLSALKGILNREASSIEFSLSDRTGTAFAVRKVNEGFLNQVRDTIKSRRSSREKLETLEGRVTELDIVECKLLLSVGDVRHRVKGDFSSMFTPSLRESLNRRVRLEGIVERRDSDPSVIHIQSVEMLDDE